MKRSQGAIFTGSENSEALIQRELDRYEVGERRRLAPGVFFVPGESVFAQCVTLFKEVPPIFIRHIAPVDRSLGAVGDLVAVAGELVEEAPKAEWSIQPRVLTGANEKGSGAGGIVRAIRDGLAPRGVKFNQTAGTHVLSVIVSDEGVMIGASMLQDNLSSWPGGAYRFREEPEQISRSEFKLLEAKDIFKFSPRSGDTALDCGGAPGGWSRILLKWGYSVTAVDPAKMDDSLPHDGSFFHVRSTCEEFLSGTDEVFSLIVNDMRMEALASAQLMADASPNLKPGGSLIVTLKLSESNPEDIEFAIQSARAELERRYTVHCIRQLFHNRQEVTAYCTKPV